MQVKYDEAVDALYIYVSREPVARSESRGEQASIDYDAAGRVVGIEILDPSSGVSLDGLPYRADVERLLEKLGFPVYA